MQLSTAPGHGLARGYRFGADPRQFEDRHWCPAPVGEVGTRRQPARTQDRTDGQWGADTGQQRLIGSKLSRIHGIDGIDGLVIEVPATGAQTRTRKMTVRGTRGIEELHARDTRVPAP